MSLVNPEDFGKSKPKVEPTDLEGDVAILTIKHFEQTDFEDDSQESGKRKGAYLSFEETGDKVIWLNKTQIVALVDRFGADSTSWIGQKVPVEKIVATFGQKKYPKVVIVGDPAEWDQYLTGKKREPKKVGGAKKKAKR